MARRTRRRRHHLLLACSSTALLLLVMAMQSGDTRARLSTALAYVALALLAVTLSLGPRNLLFGRANPVSSDLRRDCGIWSAIAALLHVAVGLTVHFRGQMQAYFLLPLDGPGAGQLRWDAFGIANYSGVVAAIGFVVLALLSSDRWLSRLGSVRWKRWQRSVYVIAALTLAHGLVYIVLERRAIGLVVIFFTLSLVMLLIQLAGILHVRRHNAPHRVRPTHSDASPC